MPNSLVKTKAQEGYWQRAKEAASKDKKVKGKEDAKYRLTNYIFQKIKAKHSK
jgi:hypothetical protein